MRLRTSHRTRREDRASPVLAQLRPEHSNSSLWAASPAFRWSAASIAGHQRISTTITTVGSGLNMSIFRTELTHSGYIIILNVLVIIELPNVVIRYLVDGIWQHDPLYPTECDINGNINNVIVITEAEAGTDPTESETVQTIPPTSVESRQGADDDSQTSGEKCAEEAVISVAGARDDDERSDNVSHLTADNKGVLPAATDGKAEVRTDIASLSCKSQGKCTSAEHKSRGKDLL